MQNTLKLESEINLETICRTCLLNVEETNHIFDIDDETGKSLAEMLQSFTIVQICDEYFPQKVCNTCRTMIKSAYNFKNNVEESEKFLLNILKKQSQRDTKNFEILDCDNFLVDFLPQSQQQGDVEDKRQHESEFLCDIKSEGSSNFNNNEPFDVIDTNNDNHNNKEIGIIEKSNKTLTCEFCNKTFNRKHVLVKHLTIHKTKFECTFCSESFTKNNDLKTHLKTVHKNNKKVKFQNNSTSSNGIESSPLLDQIFVCGICHKTFNRKYHLERHSVMHEPESKKQKFICPNCGKIFTQNDNLKTHIKKMHDVNYQPKPKSKIGDNKKLCMYCGQSFTHIAEHIRKHTGEKPFKCEQCGKAFPNSANLRQHKQTHTGAKPHLCTVCGKAFSRAFKLKHHIRTHTGEKPYKCNHCDKCFVRSMDLRYHIRRHTGVRPYKCADCESGFVRKHDLTVHCKLKGHSPFLITKPADTSEIS